MEQAERTRGASANWHEQQTFQNLGNVDAIDGSDLLVGLQSSVTPQGRRGPMVWAPYRSCYYLGFCLVNQVNRLHRALHDVGRRREECEHKQNTPSDLNKKLPSLLK